MAEQKLTDIAEICERYSVTSRALRFYEEEGLIESTRVAGSARRKYTDEQICRIQEILTLRTIGISVAEIKEYLSGNVSLKEVVRLRKAEIIVSVERKLCEIKLLNETLMALDDEDRTLDVKAVSREDRTETTELIEIARKCSEYMVSEHFELIYPYFSKTMTEYMPIDSFRAVWRDSITGIGEYVKLGKTYIGEEDSHTIYQEIIFTKITMRIKFVFHEHIIHGLWQSYVE